MSNLKSVDKVERELFRKSSGKIQFTVCNTVLTGMKGANDIKLEPFYARTFDSQKYSDMSELTSVNIRTSDYITFNYNNFEEKVSESIFISYPNLADLLNFLEETYKFFTDKKVFDKKNNVTMQYQDATVQSECLGGDKVMVSMPATLDFDGNPVRGIYIFLNDEDIYIELDEKGFYTIYTILSTVDLLTLSNQTLMLAMLGLGGSSDNAVSSGGGFKKAPKSPLANRGLLGNRRPNKVKDAEVEDVEEDDLDFDNEEDDEEEEEVKPTKKKTAKKPVKKASKKSSKEKGSPTSFKNLMEEANNIEFDDEEELDFDGDDE